MLTADDHDVPEHLFEQFGLLTAVRGRAGEQPAQEPPGPVDADEPDQPHAGGRLSRLGWHLSHQLDAERPVGLLAPSARRLHLGGDLGPDVIPQRAPARRGERLDLDLALPVPDRHPGTVLLGHDQLDLMLGPDRHLQAAEVHPF